MDEEYEGQDPNAERVGARAPATPQSQPPLGDPPATGDDRVDATMAGLRRLAGTPVDEHVAVLEEAYGQLRDILGELSEGQDRP
jgi:hypothetical protein